MIYDKKIYNIWRERCSGDSKLDNKISSFESFLFVF